MTTRLDEYAERRKLEATRKRRRDAAAVKAYVDAREVKVRFKPCRVCGAWNVEAHHIVPRSKFASGNGAVHEVDNLMPLCHAHHQAHHTQGVEFRVPRRLLLPEEIAFAEARTSERWMNRWYPTTEGNT